MPRKTTQAAPEPATEKALIGTDALADQVGQGFELRRNMRKKGERSESVLVGKRVVGEILVRPRTGVWAQVKARPKGVPAGLAKKLEARKGGWACGVLVKSDKDVAAARQLLDLAVRGAQQG